MITLTTVPLVQSVLGGNAPVGYDKFVVQAVRYEVVDKTITATLRLTSTGSPNMEALTGSLVIRHGAQDAVLSFTSGVLFTRRIALTAGQRTAVQTLLDDAQADIENGVISLGLVEGTRANGI